ncbi:MAG: TIGR03862 family flavoprotein [Sulfitobacter sp.]|nr:TIGR03862 family flavoprotein [Sulfitobacter sp.]
MSHAVVIGAGPAGLMAAEVMAAAGLKVTLCEAKPSVGRKFLMAGKSGLNLTKDEALDPFIEAFAEAAGPLASIIRAFDGDAVKAWAQGLEQEVFTGSTGRVFPVAMKASPLLRAWMGRLAGTGVEVHTRWAWQGWRDGALVFGTPEGEQKLKADVTVLALGGASWSRLGATGEWAETLGREGVQIAPFAAANAGISVDWSNHMSKHFGAALKGVAWHAGPYTSRGEATLSARGLEGGGIYSVSRGVREGHPLILDLFPDLTVPEITARLSKPRGKASLSNHLRKTLNLSPAQIALVQEMARPLPDGLRATARLLKALPIKQAGLRPMDEAISTAGGIPFDALDDTLMLRDLPGVFAAGEMLDWEAPTGGYLISACLATGRWAGLHAVEWVRKAG